MTATVPNTKVREVENKIPNHDKYITTPEFNKLTSGNFTARLEQANLVTRTDFHKKLTTFNRKITSNKTKYLEVQKTLNGLTVKDYDLFLDRIYFTSHDGSQNTFVYQPTLDTLQLKKYKSIGYVVGVYNSKLYILSHYILTSNIT